MAIRFAKEEDAAALCSIYAYYVDNFAYSFEYVSPGEQEFRERIQHTLSFYPFLVFEDGEKILGFAYAHAYHERKAYCWVTETSIYVKNGVRRQGVGSELYTELLDILKKQGFTKAVAILGGANDASLAFHKKMGFVHSASFPAMGYKFEKWHDVDYLFIGLNEPTVPMQEPIPYFEI